MPGYDPTGGSGGTGGGPQEGVPGGIPQPPPEEDENGNGTQFSQEYGDASAGEEGTSPPPPEETNTQNNNDEPPPPTPSPAAAAESPPDGNEVDGGMVDATSEAPAPDDMPTYSYSIFHEHEQKTGYVPIQTSCYRFFPIGKEKITWMNGILFWPVIDAYPDNAGQGFNWLGGKKVDIVRGHTGTFWVHQPGGIFSQFGIDMNICPPLQCAWSAPMAKEGVKNRISYNNYGGPVKPEHIVFEFASSGPDDDKPIVIPGYRVLVAPSDNLNYIDNLVDDLTVEPGVGGTYGISTISAMLRLTPEYQELLKKYGNLFPQWQDDGAFGIFNLTQAELEQLPPLSELPYWRPYERTADYGFRINGWTPPPGIDGIQPGIPYNRETIILKTNKKDIIIPAPTGDPVGKYTKELRFEGSAFLRQVQKINEDYKTYEAFKSLSDINHQAPWLKNDHVAAFATALDADLVQTPNSHYVKVESQYNFYVPEYENLIFDNDELISESLLPSLSCVGAEEFNLEVFWNEGLLKLHDPSSVNGKLLKNVHDHLTLARRVKKVFLDSLSTKQIDKDFDDASDNTGKEKDKGQYFVKWSEALQKAIGSPDSPALPDDLLAIRNQFNSQIILPELPFWNTVRPFDPSATTAATGDPGGSLPEPAPMAGKASKDPLAFKDRKRMFPAHVHIKIGKGASAKDSTLLRLLMKHSLEVALLRAVQERVDNLVFSDGVIGDTKGFWQNNYYESGTGDWDMFSVPYVSGPTPAYSYIDYQSDKYPANTDTIGNDLMFYRNPFPEAKTDGSQVLDTPGDIIPGTSSRSWLHWFMIEGQDSYEALPNENSYPGPVTNIVAAVGDGIEASVLRTHSNSVYDESEDPDKTSRILYTTNFIHEVNELLREKTRTFEQIMNGVLACEEILFWRIEKNKRLPNGELTPIQNFYLINDFTKNEIDFVDTQVKYAGQYVYKIYAWKAIFGTETGYRFPQSYFSTTKGGEAGIPAMDLGPEADQLMADYASGDEYAAYGDSNMDPNEIDTISSDDPNVIAAGVTSLLDEPTVSIEANQRWQLILNALSFPSVRILEVPFYETAPQVILDRPPLPPEIEVCPYKNVDDTILIRLTSATGEVKKMFPQAILEEDTSKFFNNYLSEHNIQSDFGTNLIINTALAEASGIDVNEGVSQQESVEYLEALNMPLTFRSDDPPSAFEIFMLGPDPETGTPRPPNSYIDFQKAERMVLPINYGTSIALRPNIEPNKKYYFTFRSVDIHGNISYPSKVYQIELVNDSGAVYLVTDIYDFPTRKRTMKKTVRKFLNIAPANDQHDWHNKAPDSVSSYVNYTPVLGDLFESSKRYKFRLTSKKSGKKLDINVKVKLTKRNTEEEKTS